MCVFILVRYVNRRGVKCSAVQSQKAITAYLTSKQLLPFGFAEQCCHHTMIKAPGATYSITPIIAHHTRQQTPKPLYIRCHRYPPFTKKETAYLNGQTVQFTKYYSEKNAAIFGNKNVKKTVR